MSNIEKEILKDLEKRLKMSDPKKWNLLSDEEKFLIVRKYYEIRETDYQNINFLLREHANDRRQISLLFVGVLIGILANPISTIIIKYLPSTTLVDDLLNLALFGSILIFLVLVANRFNSEWLGDENIIERLLQIVKQEKSDLDSTTENK